MEWHGRGAVATAGAGAGAAETGEGHLAAATLRRARGAGMLAAAATAAANGPRSSNPKSDVTSPNATELVAVRPSTPSRTDTKICPPTGIRPLLLADVQTEKLLQPAPAGGSAVVDANGNDLATALPRHGVCGCSCYPARAAPFGKMEPAAANASTAATDVDGSDTSSGERRRSSATGTSSFQALQHAVLTLYRLDDFTLEKIGEGFFSDVFKVVHRTSSEVMALKMNRSGCNRASMLREVELMNRLSHPNVVRFRGVCVHGGQLHAVIEYVNGGSLHQILVCDNDSTRLPWQERVGLAIDVSRGMRYLHSQGYIHRDLTSRNVLVAIKDGRKTAIVSDLGLAAKIPSSTDAEKQLSVVGSPYWMAPECLRGDPYNQTADVFSYGIILCETIAMVDADPDSLPRTENFGLDYIAFCNLIEDCPLYFLYLAFRCAQMDPPRRPTFYEVEQCLQTIETALQQQQKQKQSDLEVIEIQQNSSIILPDVSSPSTTDTANQAASSRGTRRFGAKDFHGHKRSKSAGQVVLSDFNGDESKDQPLLPTSDSCSLSVQLVARRMTKEDPFYTPAPANTNPFASSQRFKDGHKLLASCEADEPDSPSSSSSAAAAAGLDGDDAAVALRLLLPSASFSSAAVLRRQSLRHTSSLPELSDRVPCAADLAVTDAGRPMSCSIRVTTCPAEPPALTCHTVTAAAAQVLSVDQEECAAHDNASNNKRFDGMVNEPSITGAQDELRQQQQQQQQLQQQQQRRLSTGQLLLQPPQSSSLNRKLSLECAMLFCGLDLIRSQRSSRSAGEASEPSTPSDAASCLDSFSGVSPAAASPVDDLECEFEDDLEDVLRSCPDASGSSDCRASPIVSSLSRPLPTCRQAATTSCRSGGQPSDHCHQCACCGDGMPVSASVVPPLTGSDIDEAGSHLSRYVNPTLAEKRRQLKQVRGRSSSSGVCCPSGTVDKLEQLQLKLNHLRQLSEAEKKRRRRQSSAV